MAPGPSVSATLLTGFLVLFSIPSPAAPFEGTYSGETLSVEIELDGDSYEGVIIMGENRFPLSAAVQNDTLRGTFPSGGNAFPFTATLAGATLTLVSGGATYVLAKKLPANPLAAPANPLSSPSPLTAGKPETPPTGGGAQPDNASLQEAMVRAERETQAVPALSQTYKHPLGFFFNYPESWKLNPASEDALLLVPPDLKTTPQGPAEFFLVTGEDAGSITAPNDPQAIQFLQSPI